MITMEADLTFLVLSCKGPLRSPAYGHTYVGRLYSLAISHVKDPSKEIVYAGALNKKSSMVHYEETSGVLKSTPCGSFSLKNNPEKHPMGIFCGALKALQ